MSASPVRWYQRPSLVRTVAYDTLSRRDRKARHLAAVDSRLKELMMANVIDGFAS